MEENNENFDIEYEYRHAKLEFDTYDKKFRRCTTSRNTILPLSCIASTICQNQNTLYIAKFEYERRWGKYRIILVQRN